MAEIEIPPQAKRGLLAIQNLNTRQTRALIKAFGQEKPSLKIAEAHQRLKQKISGIDEEYLDDILYAIIGLYVSTSSVKVETEKLIEDIVRTPELEVPKEQQEALKTRLQSLLCSGAIETTIKASRVQTEYEHVFLTARAITEIRPVFQKNPSEAPGAAVITHSLKFTYREADRDRNFFLALDALDLKELKRVIDRAIQKENSIKQLLKKADVQCLEESR